jgi:hypothetical protein
MLIHFGMVIVVFVYLDIGKLKEECVLFVQMELVGMECIVNKEEVNRYQLPLVDYFGFFYLFIFFIYFSIIFVIIFVWFSYFYFFSILSVSYSIC